MTLYLDTSALVKRFVSEPSSPDTVALTAMAEAVATSLVTRVEVAAALARAVRVSPKTAVDWLSADSHESGQLS